MALDRSKEIKNIRIELIRPNVYQPRKKFNQESLEELTESIKKYGVLQPVSVRSNGLKYYELIAGERRLRAAQLAGLKEIPAIVINATDSDSAVLALIENLQREDLNYIEEAEGYESLIKDHNYTQEQLSSIIGKKQSTIANKLRILRLSDKIKQKLIEYNLTERHARAILKIPDEETQLKIIEKIKEKGYTVKKTEEIVDGIIEKIEESHDEKDNKGRRVKRAIMNAKIYINTIKNIMEKSGVSAQYSYIDKDDWIEVMVKIPKRA
ncbi:MAG: ParB/RepB/Spo0J family partition protein [Clostridiales bacterium]|nr:ParB/RepB/Spo0J family partition protein [Clostridiales bacterium]